MAMKGILPWNLLLPSQTQRLHLNWGGGVLMGIKTTCSAWAVSIIQSKRVTFFLLRFWMEFASWKSARRKESFKKSRFKNIISEADKCVFCFSVAIVKPSDCASKQTVYCAYKALCQDNTKVSSCNLPGSNLLMSSTLSRPSMKVPFIATSLAHSSRKFSPNWVSQLLSYTSLLNFIWGGSILVGQPNSAPPIARYLSRNTCCIMLSGVIRNYHCYAPTHPPKKALSHFKGSTRKGGQRIFSAGLGVLSRKSGYCARAGIANFPTVFHFRWNYRVSMAALFGLAKCCCWRGFSQRSRHVWPMRGAKAWAIYRIERSQASLHQESGLHEKNPQTSVIQIANRCIFNLQIRFAWSFPQLQCQWVLTWIARTELPASLLISQWVSVCVCVCVCFVSKIVGSQRVSLRIGIAAI